MSNEKPKNQSAPVPEDEWSDVEASLGQAMIILNRLQVRMDDPDHIEDVQAGFRRAAACLETARLAHLRISDSLKVVTNLAAQARVDSEIVAVIAGAVAAVLEGPYRIVSVQPTPAPAPHLNVWALEGRTQIFQSHRIR